MRTNRIILLVSTVVALVLGVAACGGDDEPESTTIRVAMAPPEFDSLTDGRWMQEAEDAGITIVPIEFDTGPDTMRAVAAGEADLASTSPLPVMQYLQQAGGGVTVIGAEILKTDYVLMVTPDIGDLQDLVGKTVGISEPGDISDSLTRLMLSNAGVNPDDVNFVQIGGTSARIAGLLAGEIEGGAAHVASGLAAMEQSDLRPVADYRDYIPVYAQRFLVADNDWLEENPNLAQLAVDTFLTAQRWAQDNKAEYIELSKTYEPDMPDNIRDTVYDVFAQNGFFSVNGGLDTVSATAEVERSQGNLSANLPPMAEWVDDSYVEDYLDREGRR